MSRKFHHGNMISWFVKMFLLVVALKLIAAIPANSSPKIVTQSFAGFATVSDALKR